MLILLYEHMVIIIGDAYDNNDNDGNGDDDDDDDDADGRWQKFDDSTLWWVQLLPEATFGARSIQAGIIDLAILISFGLMIMMKVMMMTVMMLNAHDAGVILSVVLGFYWLS